MFTPTYDEVYPPYGSLVTRKFLVNGGRICRYSRAGECRGHDEPMVYLVCGTRGNEGN